MTARPAGRGPEDRARLAAALRAARRAAGLTGAQAGTKAGMGQSKVSKIERAALLPSLDDVAALSRVYELPEAHRDELLALAAGLRQEQSARIILARRVGEMQHRIRLLEKSATVIRAFQPAMVLGLLQTPAYARCVFGQPDSHQLGEDEVGQAVAARVDRQAALDDPEKHLHLIMTEGALRWHAGSPQLMADQIDAVAVAVGRSNVRLGIIPWMLPVSFFPRHGFQIFDEDAVMVGTETATATMTGTSDIATYLELFTALAEVAAYDDEASSHLARIGREYRELC